MTDTAPSIIWADDAGNEAVADWIASKLSGSGAKTLAVPGGSTPFPIFDALSNRALDWGSLTFWLTDDRQVPEDHPASNAGRMKASLAKTGATIHDMAEGQDVPTFDLVWLGMGEDGHIASLFPNTNPRIDAPRQVIRLTPDPLPPEAPFDRLSLTLPSLIDCRQMMLVFGGQTKRHVFEDAASGKNDLPIARLLRNAACDVTIFWRET